MIFDNLIKPKWQHRDPEIRKSALETVSDPTIIHEIAQHDSVAEVRKAALVKITALEIMTAIAQQDPEAEVRELATQRLKQLLCGQKDHSPSLETRLAWLKQNSNAEVIAQVAVQGQEPELRLTAVEQIDREGLLGDIAINDPASEVRLAAVEKLTQKSTLERVFKAVRNRDKRVSRKAKEKLDELIESLERPKRIRAEGEAICGRLESLEQRLAAENSPLRQEVTIIEESKVWKQEQAEFKRLQERWQVIANEAEPEFQTRYSQIQQNIIALFEQYQQAQQAAQQREQTLVPLRATKQGLCEQMEALLTELNNRQRLFTEDQVTIEQRSQALQTQWANTHNLDEPAEDRYWQLRFDRANLALKKRIHKLQEYHHLATVLEDICSEVETLFHQNVALKPELVTELPQRWQQVFVAESANELLTALQSRFTNALNALATRLQEQKQQREQIAQELKPLLKDLETALENGELKTAIPLEKQARQLFQTLDNLSITRHKSLEKRLQNCTNKINQLRGWQRWGNKLERENLCQEIEDLLTVEVDTADELLFLTEEKQTAWKRLGPAGYSQQLRERFYQACHALYQRYREQLCLQMENLASQAERHPEEIARLIRDIQTKWKQLGSQGHSQELWERFNQASQIAYTPCQVHFNNQAQEREQNFYDKQALCEHLENFIQETSWEQTTDWKKIYHWVREMEHAWRNIGTTDRKVKKTIQRRFQSAMQIIQLHLDEEQQRNCRYRLRLVGQVEQIIRQLQETTTIHENRVDISDTEIKKIIEAKISEAIEQVKKIQEQWYVTVPGNRRVEREFWKVFRSNCDTVFDYRKQQQETLKQELQTYLDAKIQLCEQVEALAHLSGEAIKSAIGIMKKLKENWRNIQSNWNKANNNSTLWRKKLKAIEVIEERFDQACQQVDQRYHRQLANERRQQLDLLRLKAAFCVELEQADTWVRGQAQQEPSAIATIQSAWAQLPQLEDPHWEATIAQRFQQACMAITTSEQSVDETVLNHKETLCIRMEIAAGIESPPGAAQARMAYQVARLSEAMSGGERRIVDKPIEAEEVERTWYLSGAAPAEQTSDLEQRFNRAWQAFYLRRRPQT
jgi:hypothetical protein